MVTAIRRRLDSNQAGFTLIELLVVMIIIAILMAVAVPVFLGQKQKALATQAKSNAKHLQDTIESCAAGTTNGQLSQATLNCTTVAQIAIDEPSLSSIAVAAPAAGKVAITGGSATGYTLQSVTSDGLVTFNMIRTDNGVNKTCTGDPNALKRMCPLGTW
jgi:type IV pilus assembly protein PilA